jgi:hypothetical protein
MKTIVPNKPRIQMLVDALRSGEYKQHQGSLTNEDRTAFCCLGVATEVYRKTAKKGYWKKITKLNWPSSEEVNSFLGCDAVTPYAVSKWYGFEDNNPELCRVEGDIKVASDLNDDLNWSFKKIARAFEKKYLR